MRYAPALLALSLAVAPISAAAQSCPGGVTALVLSGGGAKGLAHLGVLQTLDSLGVRPDLIVGTSMGSIMGGLYASGYSASQIDSLLGTIPIGEIVRPFRVSAPHAWDNRIPLLFLVRGRRGFTLQTGIVDETQPNARLGAVMLRGNLLARGDFDRLPIPFRAVAADLRDRRPVVLSRGDLAQAVRASSAIPLVFPPVVRGDTILVDGGLAANIPVAQARAAGATRVIVVDVTEARRDTLDAESPIELADHLLGFLFQQPGDSLGSDDVYIRPDVGGFQSLDFNSRLIRELVTRGRRAADTSLARARCLPTGPAPPVPPLPTTQSGWEVSQGTAADSVLLGRMLPLDRGPLDPAGLRAGLLALAGAESFRGVWLHPTGDRDAVHFAVEAVPAPRVVGGMGLAYDHEQGGQGWAGLAGRQLFGTTLEASAVASLGRLAGEFFATAQWHTDAGWSRVAPMVTLRIRAEDVRRFDSAGVELPPQGTKDSRLNAGVEVQTPGDWRLRVGADLLTWGVDSLRGSTGAGGSLRFIRESAHGPQVRGELLGTNLFQRAHVQAEWLWAGGRWRILPALRAGIGNEALPLQWTFPLGGSDGFPGLHLGEERGSRQLGGSLRTGYQVFGPVEARLLLAVGRAWTPGVATDRDVLGGARIGLGADTIAGPIEVAWGVASDGRRAVYIRAGRWF